jgi:hypothetical protein
MERFEKDLVNMLEDTMLTELPNILPNALEAANEKGKLRELLELLFLDRLLPPPESDELKALPTGKIFVFAAEEINKDHLLGVAKDLGVSKERFEFYDYDRSKTYPYNTLEYNAKVCAVFFGGVPHKTAGTEDFKSVVANLEVKERKGIILARVVRLCASNELKLTKSNFREALKKLISEGRIKAAHQH